MGVHLLHELRQTLVLELLLCVEQEPVLPFVQNKGSDMRFEVEDMNGIDVRVRSSRSRKLDHVDDHCLTSIRPLNCILEQAFLLCQKRHHLDDLVSDALQHSMDVRLVRLIVLPVSVIEDCDSNISVEQEVE